MKLTAIIKPDRKLLTTFSLYSPRVKKRRVLSSSSPPHPPLLFTWACTLLSRSWFLLCTPLRWREDTCMSYEEEDTCMSYEFYGFYFVHLSAGERERERERQGEKERLRKRERN
jgi:hypothetical protein